MSVTPTVLSWSISAVIVDPESIDLHVDGVQGDAGGFDDLTDFSVDEDGDLVIAGVAQGFVCSQGDGDEVVPRVQCVLIVVFEFAVGVTLDFHACPWLNCSSV